MLPYIFLIIFYAILPPLVLHITIREIFIKHNKYGWYIIFFLEYLITLSFIPLIYFNLNLGIIPKNLFSTVFFGITIILSALSIKPAIKNKNLLGILSGTYAAFMEEILYRGILYSLIFRVSDNYMTTITITSLLFGLWHLKNFPALGKKATLTQVLYTGLIGGPIFALCRFYTGDIYLGILLHFLNNATIRLAPSYISKYFLFKKYFEKEKDNI